MLIPTKNLPNVQLTVGAPQPNDGTSNAYGMQDSIGLMPTEHRLAELGAYFTASNPTIGTAVAMGAIGAGTTSFSATAPIFTLVNNSASKRVFPRYIKLNLAGTAPTATVSIESAFVLDPAARTPTGGSVSITPVSLLGVNGATSIATLNAYSAANITVPAAGPKASTVARVRIPTGLGVVGDSYIFAFGGTVDPTSASSSSGSTRTTASAPGVFVGNAPPLVIDAGQTLLVYAWWLTMATNTASFEWEAGWFEL